MARWLLVLLVACSKTETPKAEPEQVIGGNDSPCWAVGQGFVAEAATAKYDAAYARLCSGYRAYVTLDQFTASAKLNPYLQAGQKLTGGSRTQACSGETNVGRWDVYFEGPNKAIGDMYFAKEQNVWCITGINAGGMPVLLPPAPPIPSATTKPK